jgi:hypothetical protein
MLFDFRLSCTIAWVQVAYYEEILIEYALAFLLLSNLALPSALIKLDRLCVPTTQTD